MELCSGYVASSAAYAATGRGVTGSDWAGHFTWPVYPPLADFGLRGLEDHWRRRWRWYRVTRYCGYFNQSKGSAYLSTTATSGTTATGPLSSLSRGDRPEYGSHTITTTRRRRRRRQQQRRPRQHCTRRRRRWQQRRRRQQHTDLSFIRH